MRAPPWRDSRSAPIICSSFNLLVKWIMTDKVFAALASESRRQILAYLADDELTAGEIAARFDMSKPAISKHLQLLESAGLVKSEKRGQYVWYSITREELVDAVGRFMRMVGAEPVLPDPVTGPPRPRGTSPSANRRSAGRIDRPRDRA